MSFGADFVTKKRGADVEMGLGGAAASKEGDGGFKLFLADVDVVDGLVDEIGDIAEKITTLGRGFKQVGGFSSDKKKRTADYKQLRETGDAKVKALRKKQHSLKAKQTAAPPAAAARMRPLVVSKTKAVIKVLDGLNRANQMVHEAQELETNRMLAIVAPDVDFTEEMREDIRQNGWESVMQQSLKKKVASQQMVNAQKEANERLQMAKNIAKSMQEIKQMVQDMAALVDEQTEQLSIIEQNISVAKSNLQAGNKHLDKAIEEQKKNRKKMMILVLIGTIVMIVIVLGLLGFFAYIYTNFIQPVTG